MIERLVLHVGMPHAGSVVHRSMRRLRAQLRAHGVAYVGGEQIDRLPHVAGWDREPLRDSTVAEMFETELREVISAEQRLAAGPTGRRQTQVVMCSDGLLGGGRLGLRDRDSLRPFAQRAVRHVVRALGADDVRVILHTHRQDRLMELVHAERARVGDDMSFAKRFPTRLDVPWDYRDLAQRLTDVPGVTAVVVRPTEIITAGVPAFVNDVLRHVDLDDRLDLYRIGADVTAWPAMLSTKGIALATAVSPLLRTTAERQEWQRFLDRFHAEPEPYVTNVLSSDDRRAILDAYDTANAELFAKWLPDLPGDSYHDDVTTYALGNVLAQPVDVTTPSTIERIRSAGEQRATHAVVRLQREGGRQLRRVRRRLARARA